MKCSLKSLEKPSHMSFNGMPEVFELTMASFFLNFSTFVKSSLLILRFSTITSIIQSQSFKVSISSSRLPMDIKPASFLLKNREGAEAKAPSKPAFTMRLRATGSFFSSSLKSNGTISRSCTFTPAPARRAAIPPPMIPEPITAAFLIFLVIISS